MATILPKLVLDLHGEHIPAKKFVDAASSFFSLLDEVASEIVGRKDAVRWSVSVEKGSVILAAMPYSYEPGVPVGQIVSRANAGLRELERKADRPRHFNDNALKQVRNLARISDGKTVTRTSIRLIKGKKVTKPIAISKAELHVDDILRPTTRDFGTVEGYLQTISIHGGVHFVLYESFTSQAIRCRIAEEHLDDAWKALRSKKRVAVSGLISYRASGHPTSIDVESMILLGVGVLPTAREVLGILTRVS